MILTAFLKALGQLPDRPFRSVLFRGIGLSVALLAALTYGISFLVGFFVTDAVSIPYIGTVNWIDSAASWAVIPLMIVLSVFLMVPVASAFTGLFLDDVAQAVEDRHYPGQGPVTKISLSDNLRDSLGFLGVMIAVNAVALILYLPAGPLAPFLFWAVNGYLLGREYFQMAAMRRLGRAEASRLRRRCWARIWVAGTLMVVPLSLPLVNLLIPVLGAATFTHLYHRVRGS